MKTSTLIEVRAEGRVASAPDRLPWPSLLVLGGVTFVIVTGEMLPTAVLPQMSADLGVPHAHTGLLVSLWAATVVVTSFPLVRLAARWDRRRVVVVGMVVFGASSLLTALADTFAGALASRLLGAAVAGLLWASVNSHTAAIVSERLLARAVAVVIGGATLGTVLGVPAANLAARVIDWRAAFVAVAAASVVAAMLVRLVVLPADDGAASEPRGRSIGRDPALRRLLVFAGFTGVVLVGHFAVFTFITALLGGAAGALPGQMSGVLLLFGAVSALAVLLVGRFGDRRPEAFMILAAGLVGATLLAAHWGGAHPAGAVVVVVLWGLSSGALPPLAQTMIMRLAGTRLRRTAGAIVPVMFNLGIAVGAAAGSAVVASQGVAWLPTPAAAVVLTGAAGLVGVLRPESPSTRAGRTGRLTPWTRVRRHMTSHDC